MKNTWAKNGNGMSIKIPLQFAFSLLPDVLLPSALHGGPSSPFPWPAVTKGSLWCGNQWAARPPPQPFCQITGRGCMPAETMKRCGRGWSLRLWCCYLFRALEGRWIRAAHTLMHLHARRKCCCRGDAARWGRGLSSLSPRALLTRLSPSWMNGTGGCVLVFCFPFPFSTKTHICRADQVGKHFIGSCLKEGKAICRERGVSEGGS